MLQVSQMSSKQLSAALAVILTYPVYMNILLFLYLSTFSKSISCVSSLNPGNKPHRGVGSFSITLPTAHHIGDPLSPCPDVMGKKIINDRIYFISKDCCAG